MAGLEGSVTLPAFGTVRKKTAAEVGAGAVVLVLAIWYFKQRKAAAAASSSSAGTPAGQVTDPAGNTCDASAINPATGYCTGSPQDQAAAGVPGGLDYGGGGAGGGVSGNGLSGYYYSGAGAPSTAPGPGNFADNAEWAQYVLAYLTSSAGGDSGAVSTAIGLYLTGAQVTTDQAAIIDEAIAYGGTPPQAGASGDPPGINLVAGSTGSGSSSAGWGLAGWGSSTSSSDGSSSTAAAAAAARTAPAGAISNLQANVSGTSATVRWNPATGASQGYSYVLSELNGVITHKGTTHSTSISFSNLHKGWTYNFGIQGLPGGPGDNIHIVIPK